MAYIVAHGDADGVTSTVLLLKGLNLDINHVSIRFPKNFGEYDEDTDYILDMTPIDNNYTKTVIDHHPQSRAIENPKFKLIYQSHPTSLIIYNQFSRRLSDKDRWKVVIGCVGDGQEDRIPNDIFYQYPELLIKVRTITKRFGKYDEFSIYKFKKLSSLINGPCRINNPELALTKLYNATEIDDIITDKELARIRARLDEEIERCMDEKSENIGNLFNLWHINSDYQIGGMIGIRDYNTTGITTIVFNSKTGKGEIRGVLANLIGDFFNKHNIKAGGHPSFFGFRAEGKSYKDIKELLLELSKNF